MSTNTSEHLGLHLWEPTDQVLRTEFNQNWQKIDTAVAEAREKPYVIGSYTGNGAASRTFSFPARPMLVNIMGSNNWLCAVQGASVGSGGYLGGGGEAISVTWSGHNMTVSSPSSDASYLCNWSGDRYSVVALLDANA